MNIVEKAKTDLLHIYGNDPLYRNFLSAKNSEEQNRHKDTLVSIRGQSAYYNLCKFFKEKVDIYQQESKNK